MRFYSELGEDAWIAKNFHLPEKGTYLDLGCAHAIFNSQTAFLRDRGWTGIGVDANPAWGSSWQTPFVCAVVSCYARVKFSINPTNFGISRVGEGDEIPTVTAQSIMEKGGIQQLDFLALDLEGHEFEAIKSLDIDRYRPPIIVSEYNTEGLPPDYRVRDYLLGMRYRVGHTTSSNLVFYRP